MPPKSSEGSGSQSTRPTRSGSQAASAVNPVVASNPLAGDPVAKWQSIERWARADSVEALAEMEPSGGGATSGGPWESPVKWEDTTQGGSTPPSHPEGVSQIHHQPSGLGTSSREPSTGGQHMPGSQVGSNQPQPHHPKSGGSSGSGSGGVGHGGNLSGVSTSTSGQASGTGRPTGLPPHQPPVPISATVVPHHPTSSSTALAPEPSVATQVAALASQLHQVVMVGQQPGAVSAFDNPTVSTLQQMLNKAEAKHAQEQAKAQESLRRVEAEGHVARKEAEMLRAQLEAAQQAAAEARVGGVADSAALRQSEATGEEMRQRAVRSESEMARLQQQLIQAKAENETLLHRAKAAEEALKSAEADAVEMRRKSRETDELLDSASKEVAALHGELQVIKARLSVRDTHERELLSERADLFKLREDFSSLQAARSQLGDQLDDVHRSLLMALRHIPGVGGRAGTAQTAASPYADKDAGFISQGTPDHDQNALAELPTGRLAERLGEEARRLAGEVEEVRERMRVVVHRSSEMEAQALTSKESFSSTQALLLQEQAAHAATRKQMLAREAALQELEVLANQNKELLERTAGAQLAAADLEANKLTLEADLARRLTEVDEAKSRATAAEAHHQEAVHKLKESELQVDHLNNQLRLANEEVSKWMLKYRENESSLGVVQRGAEHFELAEKTASTENLAKAERIKELRAALTTCMHERNEARTRVQEQDRSLEEAYNAVTAEQHRAEDLQSELKAMQQLSEQQVKVANEAYTSLQDISRQQKEALEHEVTKLRNEVTKTQSEAERAVETTRSQSERSVGIMLSALESEAESLRTTLRARDKEVEEAREQVRARQDEVCGVQRQLAEVQAERQRLQADQEVAAHRTGVRLQSLALALVQAVRSIAPDAPEARELESRVSNPGAEMELNQACQDLSGALVSRVKQLVWERQCCEEEVVASKEAAERAAACMEDHCQATKQLAASLADEIASAKAGEAASSESARELRGALEAERGRLEVEKQAVRRQVEDLMQGAVQARDAAATSIREAHQAKQVAEERARAALEEVSAVTQKLKACQAQARDKQAEYQAQLGKVETAEATLNITLGEKERLGMRIRDLEEQLAHRDLECEEMTRELGDVKRQELQRQRDQEGEQSLEEEVQTLRKKVTKLSSELSNARTSKKSSSKELTEARQRVEQLQSFVAVAEKDLHSLRTDKEKQRSQLTRMKSELEEAKQARQMMESQMTSSMMELQEAIQVRANLQAKLKSTADSLDKQKQEGELEVGKYLTELQAAEVALSSAHSELTVLSERSTKNQIHADDLNVTVHTLREDNVRLSDQNASMSQELHEINTKLSVSEVKVQSLEESLKLNTAQFEDAEAAWQDERTFLLKAQNVACEIADTNANAKVDRMRELRSSMLELRKELDVSHAELRAQQDLHAQMLREQELQLEVRVVLESELKQAKDSVKRLELKDAAQEAQLELQERQIRELNLDVNHGKDQREAAREMSIKVVDKTCTDLERIHSDVEAATEANDRLKGENDTLKFTVGKMEERVSELEEHLDQRRQDCARFEELCKLAQDREAEIRLDLTNTQYDLQKTAQKLQEVSSAADLERELLEKRLALEVDRVSELTKESAQHQAASKDLHVSLTKANACIQELEAHQEKGNMVRDQAVRLEEALVLKENRIMEAVSAKESSWDDQVARVERETKALLQEKEERLLAKEAHLSQALAKIDKLEAQAKEFVDHAKGEREAERVSCDKANLQVEQLQGLVEELQETLVQEREKFAHVQVIDQKREEVDMAEVQHLRQCLEDSERQIRDLETQLEDQRQLAKEVEGQVSEVQRKVAEAQAAEQETDRRAKQLELELQHTQSMLELKEKVISEHREQQAAASQRLASLETPVGRQGKSKTRARPQQQKQEDQNREGEEEEEEEMEEETEQGPGGFTFERALSEGGVTDFTEEDSAVNRLQAVEAVVAMWREACSEKDETILQLETDLAKQREELEGVSQARDLSAEKAASLDEEVAKLKQAAELAAESATLGLCEKEAEIAKLTCRLEDTDRRIQAVEEAKATERDQFELELSKSWTEVEDTKGQVEEVRSQVAAAEDRCASLEEEVARSKVSLDEAGERFTQAEHTIADLQAELVRVQEELSNEQVGAEGSALELAEAMREVTKLRKQTEEARDKEQQQQRQLEECRVHIEELESECGQLKRVEEALRRAEEEVRTSEERATTQEEKHLREKKRWEEERDKEATRRFHQIEKEEARWKDASESEAQLQRALVKERELVASASQRADQAALELKTLTRTHSQAQAQAKALQIELAQAQCRVADLEQEKQDLQEAAKHQENMFALQEEQADSAVRLKEKERAQTEEQKMALEVEVVALKEALRATETKLETLSPAKGPQQEQSRADYQAAEVAAEVAKLQSQLASKDSILAELRAELAAREGAAAQASSASERQSMELDYMRTEGERRVRVVQERVEELQSTLTAKESLVLDLTLQLDQAVSQAQAAAEVAAQAQFVPPSPSVAPSGEVDEDERVHAVEGVISTWRDAVAAREVEINDLTSQLEAEVERGVDLERQLAAATSSLARAEAAVSSSNEDATQREKNLYQLLEQSSTSLAEEKKSTQAALEAEKTLAKELQVANSKLGRTAAVLQKLLPLRSEESGGEGGGGSGDMASASSSLQDLPVVDMAKDIVLLVEGAQKHAQVLLAQCQGLQVQVQGKTEEVCALTLEARQHKEEAQRRQEDHKRVSQRVQALEHKLTEQSQAKDEQAQAQTLQLRSEIQTLKEQLQTKTLEARELSHMLRAWEAMRAGKDQQIAQLVELSKRFEVESQEKTRNMEALRQRVGGAGSSALRHAVPSGEAAGSGAGGAGSSASLAQRLFGRPDQALQGERSGTDVSYDSGRSEASDRSEAQKGPKVVQAKPGAVYSLRGVPPLARKSQE